MAATQTEEGDHKTDGLPMERVRPCLSLCLSNIISLRGCFRTYSSALCIRPKELRRRSLMPFTTVVASLSSTSGGMQRKRGTISRNTCRKYSVIKIERYYSRVSKEVSYRVELARIHYKLKLLRCHDNRSCLLRWICLRV